MGKRGPKPKPLAIRQLEGNLGRRPMPSPDLAITSGMPVVMPPEVAADEVAAREFRRVVEAMPEGVYEALDVATLSLYALSWSMLWKAQADIDAHGTMVKLTTTKEDAHGNVTTTETLKRNPSVMTWNTAATNLMKAVGHLGLVPTARAKLQLPERRAVPGRPPILRRTAAEIGFDDLMPDA